MDMGTEIRVIVVEEVPDREFGIPTPADQPQEAPAPTAEAPAQVS